jgi:hypothetical protein
MRLESGDGYCKCCYYVWRYQNDPYFRLQANIRNRLNEAFHKSGASKKKDFVEYGIDFRAICDHLGPCPGDRKDYHIDHIMPLVAFDLTDPAQLMAATAPANHRWLPKRENMSKNASFDRIALGEYLASFERRTQ